MALLYFTHIYDWLDFYKTTNTPKEFLNTTIPSKENYNKDRLILFNLLKKELLNHEDFFNNTSYFDSTEIIVDTILYSSNITKIAVLIVVKNPTYKQISPDHNHKYYYDATCYLGIRKNSGFDLSWIGPTFTNSIIYQTISNDLRKACLQTFVTSDGLYKYNMNDKRFWTSTIWTEKFTNKKE